MRLFLTSSINFVAKSIASKLDLTVKNKLVFISTAAEGEPGNKDWVNEDRQSVIDAGFEVTNYSITGKSQKEIKNDLLKFDFIHVNGGNTYYLLTKMRESGFDKVIKKLLDVGKIYIGSSAGSIITAPDTYPTYTTENQDYAKTMKDFSGMNLVNFLVLPHWGSTFFKKDYLGKSFEYAYNDKYKIILLNDYEYLEVNDDTIRIIDVRNQ